MKVDMVAEMKLYTVADMKMDMVADMKVNMVADMKVDMVADTKVDMVADMKVDMDILRIPFKMGRNAALMYNDGGDREVIFYKYHSYFILLSRKRASQTTLCFV